MHSQAAGGIRLEQLHHEVTHRVKQVKPLLLLLWVASFDFILGSLPKCDAIYCSTCQCPAMPVQEKHLPVYMRRRRDIGEPVLKTPENFGLAELHLLRAEAFFQLVSSPKDSLHVKIKTRIKLLAYILHLAGNRPTHCCPSLVQRPENACLVLDKKQNQVQYLLLFLQVPDSFPSCCKHGKRRVDVLFSSIIFVSSLVP